MASAERCIQGTTATTTTPSDTSNESKQSGDSLRSGETSRTNTIGFGTFSRSENSTVPLFGYLAVFGQEITKSSTSSSQPILLGISIEDADQLTTKRAAGDSNRIISSFLTDDGNSQNLKQPGDESHEQEICTNTTTITQGATGFQFGANSGFPPPVFGQAAIPNMNSSVKCGLAITSTSTTATSSIAIPVCQQTSSVVTEGYAFCSTSTNLLSTSDPSSGVGYGTHGRKRDFDDLGLLGQSKPIITAVTTTVNNNPFGQFSVRWPFRSPTLKRSTAGFFGQSSTSSSSQFPESATNSRGSMGLFEQQSTSGSMFGSMRSAKPSGGFGVGQPQTSTSTGPFSFCSSNSSRAEGDDGKPSNETVWQNVFGSPQNFSGATNQDNALFGNQGAKIFSSSGSTQTSPSSGGIFSNESGGGVGHLGFEISQQQKQQTSVVGQASTTTSTSSNQPLFTSMSIDDPDQSINDTPAAEQFSNTILTYLTEDENSQITKQRGYEDSGQVAHTTTTKTAQRATGLNSGFFPHVFGQDPTPSQYFRTPKFDSRAQVSDARSFSDLARSGGSAFSSAPNSASSTFETSESGQCNTGFGSEGLSAGSGDSSFGNEPSFKGYRF